MFRFSPLQLLALTFGLCLIFVATFLNQIVELWDDYRYPNAVQWQGMRVVPSADQQITSRGGDVLVVRSRSEPGARLTLFLRTDDGQSPQTIVKDLCRRDHCTRTAVSASDDQGTATYRIDGEPMQIVLMRMPERGVWIEYKGPPDAFEDFSALIASIRAQLQVLPAGSG